jgi:hypothetical protein
MDRGPPHRGGISVGVDVRVGVGVGGRVAVAVGGMEAVGVAVGGMIMFKLPQPGTIANSRSEQNIKALIPSRAEGLQSMDFMEFVRRESVANLASFHLYNRIVPEIVPTKPDASSRVVAGPSSKA